MFRERNLHHPDQRSYRVPRGAPTGPSGSRSSWHEREMNFKRICHYKYELLEDVAFITPLRISLYSYDVERDENSRWLVLRSCGELLILKGYAWDGASGAMDTRSIMRGSLVHDGLYQLMREGGLPLSYRKSADKLLRRMCREDGMFWLRAWWVYWAVRIFGKESANGNQ